MQKVRRLLEPLKLQSKCEVTILKILCNFDIFLVAYIPDVNECAVNNPCDENAYCSNARGGFACTCREGYSGDGTTCIRKKY